MKGPALFQGEIITKYRKYIDEIKKSPSQEPLSQFQLIWHKHSWMIGIHVSSNEEPIDSR